MNRGSIAASAEPPTRGQQLAIYDAVVWWVAFVEREWRDLAPGEAMSGTATDTLEPILLDAWSERFAEVSQQLESWLDGEAKEIPERASSEAERCLRAAVYAYGSALDHSVRDQIEGIAKRESADHWWGIHEDPDAPERAPVLNEAARSMVPVDRRARALASDCGARELERGGTHHVSIERTAARCGTAHHRHESRNPRRRRESAPPSITGAIRDELFDVAEELRATMVDAVRRARSGNDA